MSEKFIRAKITADAERIAAAVPLIAPLVAIIAGYRWIDQEVVDEAIAGECEEWHMVGRVRHAADKLVFQETIAWRVYTCDLGGGMGIFDHAFNNGDCAAINAMIQRIGNIATIAAGERLCRRYPERGTLAAIFLCHFDDQGPELNMADIIHYLLSKASGLHYHVAQRELKLIADEMFRA